MAKVPKDRRSRKDRRSWKPQSSPPKDQVTKDRRKCPDRRVNNIEVVWVDEEDYLERQQQDKTPKLVIDKDAGRASLILVKAVLPQLAQ